MRPFGVYVDDYTVGGPPLAAVARNRITIVQMWIFVEVQGNDCAVANLAGLKWGDFDFKDLHVHVTRSLVDQHVGPVKTEAWYELTPYKGPSDYIWASDANRAGAKRGKQPVWLSPVMRDHIQPATRKLGITKKISWHTIPWSMTTQARFHARW